MDEHQVVWNEKVAAKIIQNLEKRRMAGSYAASVAKAKEEVLEMIPQGATVFRCGSMTVGGMGLWEAIAAIPEVNVIDPYLPKLSPEEGLDLRRRGLTADVMIASTNAITLDGRLVNLDGMGNRVAAMIFGPRKVVLVAGANKITPDLPTALKRVREVAAHMRAKSLGMETPCAESGRCADCRAPQRICRVTAILHRPPMLTDITVVLVAQALGF